jgi:hypothetical protein
MWRGQDRGRSISGRGDEIGLQQGALISEHLVELQYFEDGTLIALSTLLLLLTIPFIPYNHRPELIGVPGRWLGQS